MSFLVSILPDDWTLNDLATSLNINKASLRNRIAFWIGQGVIIEKSNDHFTSAQTFQSSQLSKCLLLSRVLPFRSVWDFTLNKVYKSGIRDFGSDCFTSELRKSQKIFPVFRKPEIGSVSEIDLLLLRYFRNVELLFQYFGINTWKIIFRWNLWQPKCRK